jgi:hypothetical protein
MLLPSASRRLERRRVLLRQRREKLFALIGEVDRELEELDVAENVLRQSNGSKRKLPDILRTPETQKDRVLAIVRSRPIRGVSRQGIAARMAAQGHPIGINSISTYLSQLRRDGLVRSKNQMWFAS